MIKTRRLLFGLLFSLLLLPLGASAFTVRSGDMITLPKDEVIEGNFYAAGANLIIDGMIKGDLICAGQNITVNGIIEGDVLCAASNINLNNKIGGNARLAGSSINLSGEVGKNVMVGSASFNSSASSSIGGEVLFGAATADFKGRIGGDLVGAASGVSMSGINEKDVRLYFDRQKDRDNRFNNSGLVITDKAEIKGNLTYNDKIPANISNQAKIGGKITQDQPKHQKQKQNFWAIWLWSKIFSIFAALVVGMVLVSLWKDEVLHLTDQMDVKKAAAIGWGAVILVIVPAISLLLLFTLIGIPLAILLILFWIIGLMLAKILVAIMIGQKITRKYSEKYKTNLFAALLIGVVVTYFIYAIPVLGWMLSFIAILWGLGGMFLFFKKA